MNIPDLQHPCWRRLVTGSVPPLKTDQLALQLLCSRLQRSDAPVDKRVAELSVFFTKFHRILNREIAQLVTL